MNYEEKYTDLTRIIEEHLAAVNNHIGVCDKTHRESLHAKREELEHLTEVINDLNKTK